ncbi:MAG: ABC transporter substrate-binding protein [Candidatus Nitrohelix vancouverensis]|uniref:ABC transporter substrate-binding protein n=1 Tax=Candidatus Nitrohelix vancouverensis TaxID=2705534 RepID=A0A7T0C1T4_9BACT|nr:MAG: ABC transporter substrate-binding protein [Candidatus Nitrohelix vancouverensis]
MLKQRPAFWIFPVLIAFLCLALPTFAVASEITDDLKNTIDKVIKIVTDESLKSDPAKRRATLRDVIDKRFNYKQMVIRSLAQNWDERTPQEREQFIELFQKLLENSYASKLESYRDEKIEYVGEQVKGQYALINTKIIRKDAEIEVDYKMINEDGAWKVYDFVIERVSMIRNYRSQFTKIIRKESYSGLVTKLENKIKDLELNGGESDTL